LTLLKDKNEHLADIGSQPLLLMTTLILDKVLTPAAHPPAAAPLVPASVWSTLFGPPRLAADELRGLQELAQVRSLCSGACVFKRGESADTLVAVLEGAVGLGAHASGAPGSASQFHLERAVHGPQWLDNSSAWLEKGRSQDAQALMSARLLELPVSGVRVLLTRHPVMSERLLQCLAQSVQNLTGAAHDLMAKDAQKRLATWLLQRSPASGEEVALRERKRELAAQLAITPETLSRLLRQLMSAGLIEVRGYTIKLLNLAALQTLAQG